MGAGDQRRRGGGRERERRLEALATRQHGVVGRWQLVELGFGRKAIAAACDRRRLTHVHREVFAVGHRRLSRRGREWAALLAYGPGTLLSHRSAAALWGIVRPDSGPVHVTANCGRQGKDRRAGAWVHRCKIGPEDRAEQAGMPITTVARTLFDLAEAAQFESVKRAWEEADRLGLLQLAAVERVVARGRGRRSLRPIRALLGEAHDYTRTRSPLEQRFQRFLMAHRLPPPATNVLLLGREVDCLWPAAKLIAELDSWEFHANRSAFERDRARDTRLLLAGYRTIRVTHRRLDREANELADEIRGLLQLGEIPAMAPTGAAKS